MMNVRCPIEEPIRLRPFGIALEPDVASAGEFARTTADEPQSSPLPGDRIYERWAAWSEKQRDLRDLAWVSNWTFSSSSLPPPY
jgi:hypothetical protein